MKDNSLGLNKFVTEIIAITFLMLSLVGAFILA